MRAWNRLLDTCTLLAGVYAALSPLWVDTHGNRGAVAAPLVLGVLIALDGVWSLRVPGAVSSDLTRLVLGVLLFVSPWFLTYDHFAGAKWSSWVPGAIAAISSMAALPGAASRRHTMLGQH